VKIYRDTQNKRKKDKLASLSRKEEYRKDWAVWDEHEMNFPEKMYQDFVKSLKNSKNDICFFDIGAAEGIYSRAVLKYTKNSQVVCFEPEDERMEILIENLKDYSENGDLHIHQKIVASETSKCSYLKQFTYSDGRGAGSSTPVNVEDPYKHERDSYLVPYQSVKLDDFMNDFDNINLIKIDVEGGEIDVLKGSVNLLEKHRPVIFLEAHTSARFGHVTLEKIYEILNSLNFKYKYVLLDMHGGELEYYLFIPQEKVST
jgi:FkbM family methyltransferase